MTPDGLKSKCDSIVFSALANTVWSLWVGVRLNVAGTKYAITGPNWATTLPAPLSSVSGPLMKFPMSNWIAGSVVAAGVAVRVAAPARLGVNATCSNRATWAANATPKPAFNAPRRLSLGVLNSSKGIGVPPHAEKLGRKPSVVTPGAQVGVTCGDRTGSSYAANIWTRPSKVVHLGNATDKNPLSRLLQLTGCGPIRLAAKAHARRTTQ